MRKVLRFLLLLSIIIMFNSIEVKADKWEKIPKVAYAKGNIIIYKKLGKNKYDTYVKGDKIKIIAEKDNWYQVRYRCKKMYIRSENVSFTKVKKYKGKKLNKRNGVVYGPTGRESYYNLPMNRVVSAMRKKGYSKKKYPYWVRRDGCKMLGPYIMVAANYKYHRKGSVINTSLGQGIVCDTGSFIYSYPKALDIAVDWR